jgi:hypothetical protein
VKRLVLVVGVGRSGTSLLAGVLGQLGFHIPQPEVTADDTNPKGFGEPRWVVDFHSRLMRRLRVIVFDARPVAFEKTAAVEDAAELRAWLADELAQADDVVVKDPRVGWFLNLWKRACDGLDVEVGQVTMLRHPAEILTSARKSYGDWQSDASRAAAWLNVMLETERQTRGARRVYIRYEDLLADWRAQMDRAGRVLELPLLTDIAPERAAAVDAFVDPGLHRARTGWEGLEVPERVSTLCDRVWELFVAGPEERAGELDAALEEYRALYREAEAISQPSVTAVRPRKKAAPPTLRAKIARRVRRLTGR